jgi:divalent metal cation (Fe/Co/Zn/Cd) transporter
VDNEALVQLAEVINRHKNPAVIDIHNVRMIRSGNFHHIDAHMVVPEFWDVAHVHAMTHAFETNVVKDYHYDGEFAFHVDPCKRAYCKKCDLENCHIRAGQFEKIELMTQEHLIKGPRYTNES